RCPRVNPVPVLGAILYRFLGAILYEPLVCPGFERSTSSLEKAYCAKLRPFGEAAGSWGGNIYGRKSPQVCAFKKFGWDGSCGNRDFSGFDATAGPRLGIRRQQS